MSMATLAVRHEDAANFVALTDLLTRTPTMKAEELGFGFCFCLSMLMPG